MPSLVVVGVSEFVGSVLGLNTSASHQWKILQSLVNFSNFTERFLALKMIFLGIDQKQKFPSKCLKIRSESHQNCQKPINLTKFYFGLKIVSRRRLRKENRETEFCLLALEIQFTALCALIFHFSFFNCFVLLNTLPKYKHLLRFRSVAYRRRI